MDNGNRARLAGGGVMRSIEDEATTAAMRVAMPGTSDVAEPVAVAPSRGPNGLQWETVLPGAFAPNGNVVTGDRHRVQVGASLEYIAQVIGKTMGPHGANALVRDAHGDHFATKDGYSVIKRMTFVTELPTMVLDHVRTLSRKLVKEVGDGSSTAVIAADGLFRATCFETTALSVWSPRRFTEGLSITAEAMAQVIQARGKATLATTPERLDRVAAIATNNDGAAGKFIAGIYAEHGADANVSVTVSRTRETRAVPSTGYRLMRGFIDACFATETDPSTDSKVCRLDRSAVLMWQGALRLDIFAERIAPVIDLYFKKGMSVVLVANEFASEVSNSLITNRTQNKLPILAVDHSSATRNSQLILEDLALVLGGEVYSEDSMPTEPEHWRLGEADSVTSRSNETVLFKAVRPPEVNARVDEIDAKIRETSERDVAEAFAGAIDDLRSRRRALSGKEVALYVGGETEQEKATKVFLYEDAVLACQAALRGGIVEGGGMAVLRVCSDSADEVVKLALELLPKSHDATKDLRLIEVCMEVISRAFVNVQRVVLTNARQPDPDAVVEKCLEEDLFFDADAGAYRPAADLWVPAPAATDAAVLRTACSIVGLLLSSNQTVLVRPDIA